MIDAQNKLWHHLIILVISSLLAYSLSSIGIRTSRVLGIVPFIILFLVMIIGPLMVIFPSLYEKLPEKFPYNWRAELGIWFAIWSLFHFLYLLNGKNWDFVGYISKMSPWGIGSLIALVMAIILACISFKSAINYLGQEQWKWIQNYFTYVIWWLLVLHIIWAFIRNGFPPTEFLYWIYLLFIIIVPLLQLIGFIKKVNVYRKNLKDQIS